MSDKLDTRVIQITNVAPGATREQMKTLFGYIGHIDELKLYPPEESEVQVPARVCYVKYDDTTSVGVALHLTNTVFIDRALIVVPVMDGKIPDEQTALQMAPSAIAGMMPGQPTWPSNVMSQLQGTGTNQVITTNDPRLTAHGLPQYPPLPGSTDPAKIEEIRRTVVVGNLDSITTGEHVLSFFSQVGEIKYVKLSEDSDGTRIALVEFSDQRSIASALTYNGVMFQNRPLRVTHSYSSIIKPQNKHQQAAQREIEEAMKKVKEAQSLITAAADMGDINIDKTVSKLANDLHSRSRSRSKSKKRRSRSHSRHRSSSKSHKSRSRSRQRSKSRQSRSKKRSRSRSKKQRSKSRSKSRSRRNRSRSRKSPKPEEVTASKERKSPKPEEVTANKQRSRRRSSLPRRSRSQSRRQRSKSRSRKSPKPEEVTASKQSRRSRSSKRSTRKSRSRSRKRSRSKSKRSGSQEKIKVSDTVEKKSKSRSLSPPKLEREESLYEESSSRRSRSSSRARSRSRSRRISSRRSRSRSGSRRRSRKGSRRSRSRSRKRSRSRRRSRSRSGSRHRSRKDKKRDTERSRGHSRDKDKEKSKRKHKEKEKEKDDKKDSKVTRNYDEEEQTIYDDSAQANSASGRSTSDRMESRNGGGTTAVLDTAGDDSNLQQIDMDMSD
ncbi:hypothetical protein CHS0354_025299 [Potamilus streckersoni]|uniref:RRM domain-containing protein n=1 Tax=Potamilus streckersoni TaxID=2493646 RepID=A0AAE0RYU7_9BIVA|nr:hypothetical protein CHS0354_025299 [Potamilus streckersoni]